MGELGIDPHTELERSERQRDIGNAVALLPDSERAVVVLFYINDHSREEIAEFLGITAVAVKKRLASARRRLKERMLHMIQDDLHEQRPSRDGAFAGRVTAFSRQFSEMLRDGSPILKTLETCAQAQSSSPRLQQAILEMREQVRVGAPIRDVMARYPDLFEAGETEAVFIGEELGFLDLSLERIAAGERFAKPEKLAELRQEMQSRSVAR